MDYDEEDEEDDDDDNDEEDDDEYDDEAKMTAIKTTKMSACWMRKVVCV